MKINGFLVAAVFGLLATNAQGATVNIVSDAGYQSNDFDTTIGDRNVFDRGLVDVDDTNLSGTSYSTSSAASGIGASAAGFGSVDIDSGLLRSRTQVADDDTSNRSTESAGSTTTSALTTFFTAETAGEVTVNLAVDGFWDLVRDAGNQLWQAQASLALGTAARDAFVLNSSNSANTGSIDTILGFTFFATEGTEYSVTSTLLTQISAGAGIVDFSNTAALTFDTDVSLFFSDSRVLTNLPGGGSGDDGDPSVIPLPAGLPMLATAMLGLMVLRRRARTV